MPKAQKVLILGFNQISLGLLSAQGPSLSRICQLLFLNASNTVLNMHLQGILAFFSPQVIAFLCTFKMPHEHS